jgi:hypothetical protein
MILRVLRIDRIQDQSKVRPLPEPVTGCGQDGAAGDRGLAAFLRTRSRRSYRMYGSFLPAAMGLPEIVGASNLFRADRRALVWDHQTLCPKT